MAGLTDRAERAALGAMIADPGHTALLGYLMPDDFADPRHRAVFIGLARAIDEPGMSRDAYQAAVALAADGRVSTAYLHELIAACPDPRHADTYGAMVIQARLSRRLAHRAGELNYEAAELGCAAQNTLNGGTATEKLAAHLEKLATAFREHAAALRPAPDNPVTVLDPAQRHPLTATAGLSQQRHEERVLSALLQGHPESRRIFDFLPVAAFTDEVRQEIFQAIRALGRTNRPVDALTVDWELSQRSVPFSDTSETYTTRLASATVGDTPLKDAYALAARLQRRTSSPLTSPSALPIHRGLVSPVPEQTVRELRHPQLPMGAVPRQPGPEQRM